MEGEFPEQFKCPICFEIPEKEIFQCQNGHTICNKCIKNLTLCPQCRVSLGLRKIRNRGLEDLLDLMKFDCSFKTGGCKAKVSRKEISSHNESCNFGKDYIMFCQNLGLKCDHKYYTKKLNEFIEHLKAEHSFISKKAQQIDLKLINFKNTPSNSTVLWTPVILTAFSEQYIILVYSTEDNFSVLSISMEKEHKNKIKIQFEINSTLDDLPNLGWTTNPIPCNKSKIILKYLPFKFDLDLLKKGYVVKDDLTISIKILEDKLSTASSKMTTAKVESICLLPNKLLQTLDHQNMTKKIQEKITKIFKFGDDTASCNSCLASPIRGVVYICLQCKDYELCSTCMLKNEHSFHHFTIICSDEQVVTLATKIQKNETILPYVDCIEENTIGYEYGSSMQLDSTDDWCCQMCANQPDYVCLQCYDRYGLCKYCFLKNYEEHNKQHLFVVTMNDSARQFALYILRKSKLLPQLPSEMVR